MRPNIPSLAGVLLIELAAAIFLIADGRACLASPASRSLNATFVKGKRRLYSALSGEAFKLVRQGGSA